MRGFAQRMDVEEVERLLRGHTTVLPSESVELADLVGRVLTEAVEARVDVPSFDRSAMDGYAVRGEDTFGASDYGPLTLQIVGEAYPGRPFDGRVGPGEAARIMTGAPLPAGADAVVMAEVCTEADARVEVREAVSPRKHVGAVGEDIRAGDVVLHAGRRLRAQDAGLLASIGVARAGCVRRPRVRMAITGDELLPAGSQPEGAQIGSSVGQEDHAPRLVAELGTLDFHGVSMRPSSPAGGGRIGEHAVFLLPGNPVSCLCAYEFFAGPTIRALGGRSRRWPHVRVRLPLARKISSQVGRTDYVRVGIEAGLVVPLATSGASILSSTVRADGVVLVARDLEGMPEGAEVEVLLYGGAEEIDA